SDLTMVSRRRDSLCSALAGFAFVDVDTFVDPASEDLSDISCRPRSIQSVAVTPRKKTIATHAIDSILSREMNGRAHDQTKLPRPALAQRNNWPIHCTCSINQLNRELFV